MIGARYVDTIETEREPGETGPTCRYRLDLDKGINGQQGAAADGDMLRGLSCSVNPCGLILEYDSVLSRKLVA